MTAPSASESFVFGSSRCFGILLAVLFSATLSVPTPSTAQTATTLPAGFQESVVFRGLVQPTAIRFAPDGRIFVAEKRGVIKVFDSLSDATPTVFADLNANVYNSWDRGLLGLELDPGFPVSPYVYVLYTYDYNPATGQSWGTPGVYNDPCPSPPGATADGCVVLGRVSRLQANGNVVGGAEQVLLENWCQQFPSHSIGALAFGSDGGLYVAGGEGASFNWVDYGQTGSPRNPCGDPPGGAGSQLTTPTAEGGALRSQDLRTPGDSVGLSGAILRIDPASGAPMPDTAITSPDANSRRIIAYGLRNPFRMTVRPRTTELWIGDVGWGTWEEINRVRVSEDGVVENFGWPCYEGAGRQPSYDSANLNICENLYQDTGAVSAPFYSYGHSNRVVSGESCPTGSSAISGLAFYTGTKYPPSYANALFFADYARGCIWVMYAGADGVPDPSKRATMVSGASTPADLQIGPDGDLFYVDLAGGTVRRISYFGGNQPPTAMIQATPTSGIAPLSVTFDGSGSTDPDPGDQLTYSWDLDADGQFGDSTVRCCPSRVYSAGMHSVQLRATDAFGESNTASVLISSSNTPPLASIQSPTGALKWKAGESISFSGSATDQQDGALAPGSLSWSLLLNHCPSNCHQHPLGSFSGVSSGTFTAPDHEYPSHLELRLNASDSGGLENTTGVLLYPETVSLRFDTSPSRLQLVVNGKSLKAPFASTLIVGSRNTISAPSPQFVGKTEYRFVSWSDGGAQTHDISPGSTAAVYTATYVKVTKR